MSKIVFYASTGGNTKAAAEYIASKIGGEAVPIDDASKVDLSTADTVVFGSRVHAGSIDKNMAKYIADNIPNLVGKKVAYVVCCLFDEERGQNQCSAIGSKMNLTDGVFFKGIKKKIAAGDTKELDAFVEKVNRL